MFSSSNYKIEKSVQHLLDFLHDYIGFDSVAPKFGESNVRDVQYWLAEKLSSWKIFDQVEIWEDVVGEPNVAASIFGTGNGRSLMFNGHSDVVPVTAEQLNSWIKPGPWESFVLEDKVYGRGTSDMKGGNAAAIFAVKSLIEEGYKPLGNIILAFNIGEECVKPEIGIESVLNHGFSADIVINMEPTSMVICPAGVGFFYFKIDVEGKAGHPAVRRLCVYPAQGVDYPPAIDAFAKLRLCTDDLDNLFYQWGLYKKHPLLPPGTMTAGPVFINAGELSASIPEKATAVYSVAFNPGLTSKEVLAEIKSVLDNVSSKDYWLREHPPVIEAPYLDPVFYEPFDIGVDHPAVQVLTQAYSEALNNPPRINSLWGPCDANIVASHNIDVLVFGPGDIACNIHSSNEFIPLDNLVNAVEVYRRFITKWCS